MDTKKELSEKGLIRLITLIKGQKDKLETDISNNEKAFAVALNGIDVSIQDINENLANIEISVASALDEIDKRLHNNGI